MCCTECKINLNNHKVKSIKCDFCDSWYCCKCSKVNVNDQSTGITSELTEHKVREIVREEKEEEHEREMRELNIVINGLSESKKNKPNGQ